MKSIVITPQNNDELRAVSSFLKLLKIKSQILSDSQKEDIGLWTLMQEEKDSPILNKTEKVNFENWLRNGI
ncbi:hypothetical protein LV89_00744 [Arcicella aurantiaca]|jgi:hypothetical protein|uniref:Uncharacterized protein n=1 Tax=Arcicella aurantiaca TaxID=591202 RepID=A0A316EEN6_9BACT|nr:hypothetical protein [Arcicella aurantiaca]PWK28540.1 hypothetical protein LV89_00744 [Arcicella aurantiaca]